jgi:hypothetical protein
MSSMHAVHAVSAASFIEQLGASSTPANGASSSSTPAAGGASAAAPASYLPAADVDLRELFEARRPVRPVIKTGQSATIPMRTLNAELTCPVCLGIIRECTAVMECLHRFCSSQETEEHQRTRERKDGTGSTMV